MEKGYIQVYTGDGKGKTTAALGVALRSLCAGKRVLIMQFLKGQYTSELAAMQKFDNLTIQQVGEIDFIKGVPSQKDAENAQNAYKRLCVEIMQGDWDVVIADELNVAIDMRLVAWEDVIQVLAKKATHTEVIITGRNAHPEIVFIADLVTEMKEIKHYWKQGVQARVGIEK